MKTKLGTYKQIGIERDYEFYKGVSGYDPNTGKSYLLDDPYIDWVVYEIDLMCGHKGMFRSSGIGADEVFCEICKA